MRHIAVVVPACSAEVTSTSHSETFTQLAQIKPKKIGKKEANIARLPHMHRQYENE